MNYLDFVASSLEYYQRVLSPVSQKFKLTSMEFTILLYLANNPGHDTASEIVKKRHLTKSHVSTSVKSLINKGLLRKEHRENNRRTEHLVLTESCSIIIQEGKAAQKEFFDRLFFGLSKDRLAVLISCFEQMNRNITEALEEK